MSIIPIIILKINHWVTLDFFDFAGYGHFTMKSNEKNEINGNVNYSKKKMYKHLIASAPFSVIRGAADSILPPGGGWPQEAHHGSHALMYFSLLAYAAIHGVKISGADGSAARIGEHLSCLKEFLAGSDAVLADRAAGDLLAALKRAAPRGRRGWIRFISFYRDPIRVLADRYDRGRRALPEKNLEKIGDLAARRSWRKIWWWRIVLSGFQKKAVRFLRKTICRGFPKIGGKRGGG
jgi:hypothetical protein